MVPFGKLTKSVEPGVGLCLLVCRYVMVAAVGALLPDEWQEIRFRLRWRGSSVQVAVGHAEATFTLDAPDGVTEQIVVGAGTVTLVSNTPVTVRLSESSQRHRHWLKHRPQPIRRC